MNDLLRELGVPGFLALFGWAGTVAMGILWRVAEARRKHFENLAEERTKEPDMLRHELLRQDKVHREALERAQGVIGVYRAKIGVCLNHANDPVSVRRHLNELLAGGKKRKNDNDP